MKNLEEVSNRTIFNPAKLQAEGITGQLFTGEFVELKEEERKTKDKGKKFMSRSYIFRGDDGKEIILNSTGHLKYLMEKQEVQPGDRVSVIFLGKDDPEDEKSPYQFRLIAA